MMRNVKLKLGGLICTYLLFSLFLNSCVRPEDNATNAPTADSTFVVPEKSGPAAHTIEISEMKFHPEKITVQIGDTVIWINHDMVAHCVTEEVTKAWTSDKIPNDSSWKMVVKTSADYFCAIHQVMKGKIICE